MWNSKRIQISQIPQFLDSVWGRYDNEKGQLQEIIQAPDVIYSNHYIYWMNLSKTRSFKKNRLFTLIIINN